jgi:hypothetical protein
MSKKFQGEEQWKIS